MKIIKHGNTYKKLKPLLFGTCLQCGCQVSCRTTEATILVVRTPLVQHVKCPECGNTYLWVK